MLIIGKAIELGMNTLEVVTVARNRKLMEEFPRCRVTYSVFLITPYGQDPLGRHTYYPHLHEISIMLRELWDVLD
ncbi:MAG: hypothetical protein ACOC3C_07335 [Candidatus Thorarchaeota archaeon]